MTNSDMKQQEETYECNAEVELEYLKKMDLLDNIEFKYIEGYLPFDEIPVIDFEWELIGNSNGYEYDVKYRFTLENEEKKLEKTFSGVLENINTSSYLAYIFMELGEYYETQKEEEEEDFTTDPCDKCKKIITDEDDRHFPENWNDKYPMGTMFCGDCLNEEEKE